MPAINKKPVKNQTLAKKIPTNPLDAVVKRFGITPKEARAIAKAVNNAVGTATDVALAPTRAMTAAAKAAGKAVGETIRSGGASMLDKTPQKYYKFTPAPKAPSAKGKPGGAYKTKKGK